MAKKETNSMASSTLPPSGAEGMSIAEEKVSKAQYDELYAEYQRVSAAFNKAINIMANDYAQKVSKEIFDLVDASRNANN